MPCLRIDDNPMINGWLSALSRAVLLSWLFMAAPEAAETVFRCTLADGRIEFSQYTCRDGVQEELQIEDRLVGWDAPRVALKTEQQSRSNKGQKSRNRRLAKAARRERERRDKNCWKKEQQVEKIQWRMRRGYKAGKGVELRRRRREYEAYLRKFCG